MIKIIVNGVELEFGAREVFLPEYGQAFLEPAGIEDIPSMKKVVKEALRITDQHEDIGKFILEDLEAWYKHPQGYFFIIGRDAKNGRVLGVANGNVICYGGEISGLSQLTINTGVARGIGEELVKAKVETFFSSPEVGVVYALHNNSGKSRRILLDLGFEQEPIGNYYHLLEKESQIKPFSLTREFYNKRKSEGYIIWPV